MTTALFDSWIDQYDAWFTTPAGILVKKYETALLMELLAPEADEMILDGGCGTGIFTSDILACGAWVTGVDLSMPMLEKAVARNADVRFTGSCADICSLPFADNCFDRVFSMTAIEFVADARAVVAELERVVKVGGCVVVTTLNSLSPWAVRRRNNAREGHSLFQHAHFRSPEEMRLMVPANAVIRTAIHFNKYDPVSEIPAIEQRGAEASADTGAFLAVQWRKM